MAAETAASAAAVKAAAVPVAAAVAAEAAGDPNASTMPLGASNDAQKELCERLYVETPGARHARYRSGDTAPGNKPEDVLRLLQSRASVAGLWRDIVEPAIERREQVVRDAMTERFQADIQQQLGVARAETRTERRTVYVGTSNEYRWYARATFTLTPCAHAAVTAAALAWCVVRCGDVV